MTARLAIVDDDAAFTGYLHTLLAAQGYGIEVFNSGTALLEGLRAGSAPNVILLDVLMPDLDGIETLRAIRQARPAAQVVVLGRQAPQTIIEAVRLGAADYVLKPGDPDGVGEAALEAAIRNALERESLSAEVARLSAQAAEDPQGTQGVVGLGRRDAAGAGHGRAHGRQRHQRPPARRERHRQGSAGPRAPRPVAAAAHKPFVAGQLRGAAGRRCSRASCSATSAAPSPARSATRVGRFELADGGTIFLDEIGEMARRAAGEAAARPRERAVRAGSAASATQRVDVRIVAATNRNLERGGRDRPLPRGPLLPAAASIEVRDAAAARTARGHSVARRVVPRGTAAVYRRPAVRPGRGLLEALIAYPWPGNIRELENMMKRYVVLQEESLLIGELVRLQQASQAAQQAAPVMAAPAHVPALMAAGGVGVAAPPAPPLVPAPPPPIVMPAPAIAIDPDDIVDDKIVDADSVDLQALARNAAMKAEREAIDHALAKFRWNRRKAAAYLKVSYKTLLNKMKECGISEPAGAP